MPLEHSHTIPSWSHASNISLPTPDLDASDEQSASTSHQSQIAHRRDELWSHDHEGLKSHLSRKSKMDEEQHNIGIQSASKHVEMTIAPFLTEHIPMQYNPTGGEPRNNSAPLRGEPKTSTKFCYRHHPDLKCRRQANEPSMEQLQNELASLSQSDQQAISHVWSLFSAAPGKHRNLMLQGILTQCCFPQLSFISDSVRDLIKIDFLSALPAELSFKILCYLDTTSLCKAAQVSQRWRSLADDDVVWHKMCEQHIDRKCTKCGWGLPLLERKRLRNEKRQIQLRASGRGLNQWSPDITPIPEEPPAAAKKAQESISSTSGSAKRSLVEPQSPELSKRQRTSSSQEVIPSIESNNSDSVPRRRPWKDIYKDRFKVGTAWKYGRCTTKVFKGHTNGVMCLQFNDNIMITGSYDATAKVWDIHTGECIRTITGHTSGIRCLQFEGNMLLTGSLDSTIKAWNWQTGALIRTFEPHTDGVIGLHFTKRFQASGSRDKTIRVWDKRTRKPGQPLPTFRLYGHTDWVNSVKIDDTSETLVSASDDLTVRMWDLRTQECIRVFEGHVGHVQQVVLMPAEFELDEVKGTSSDQDDDSSSVSSVTIATSHQDVIRGASTSADPFWPNDPDRPAPPRYMLTGGLDATIRLWDTHFRPPQQREPTPEPQSSFEILPTDPLTNSHTPRAQACVRTFFGHVEGIWALSADHLRLISGSEDRMMKVWDPRTGKCERTFTGHQGPVTCAWLSDSRVASGSEDCEVRMLCFDE